MRIRIFEAQFWKLLRNSEAQPKLTLKEKHMYDPFMLNMIKFNNYTNIYGCMIVNIQYPITRDKTK